MDTQTLYAKLIAHNRLWVQEMLSRDPNYFADMTTGQQPHYLFIGCSDSRVPAQLITGAQAGEMFVHRNIANQVHVNDLNVLSVIQYSVEVLKVPHIIVCGHYGCGGIRAAMERRDYGLINKWLGNIKQVYRRYRPELDALPDEQRFKRLVELNVVEQVVNVCSTSYVQRAWQAKKGLPQVHGWVYDLSDGLIRDLNVDCRAELDKAGLLLYDDVNPAA